LSWLGITGHGSATNYFDHYGSFCYHQGIGGNLVAGSSINIQYNQSVAQWQLVVDSTGSALVGYYSCIDFSAANGQAGVLSLSQQFTVTGSEDLGALGFSNPNDFCAIVGIGGNWSAANESQGIGGALVQTGTNNGWYAEMFNRPAGSSAYIQVQCVSYAVATE
jgi:hypothetical protein